MHTNFHEKFRELETKRLELFKTIDQLDEKTIQFKPNPGKWSALQIIFHLVKSEQLTLLALNKSITDKRKLTNSGIISKISFLFLHIAPLSKFKFKAPNILGNVPDKYNIEELKRRWEKIRKELNNFLENYPPDLYNKNIFKHPKAGFLNLDQTIDFLIDHFDHHNKQIKNLLLKQSSR